MQPNIRVPPNDGKTFTAGTVDKPGQFVARFEGRPVPWSVWDQRDATVRECALGEVNDESVEPAAEADGAVSREELIWSSLSSRNCSERGGDGVLVEPEEVFTRDNIA